MTAGMMTVMMMKYLLQVYRALISVRNNFSVASKYLLPGI